MNSYNVIYSNGSLIKTELMFVERYGYKYDKSFLEYLIYNATKLEDKGFNVSIAIKLNLINQYKVEYNTQEDIGYSVNIEWENDINKPKSIEGAELYYESISSRLEQVSFYGCALFFKKKIII